MSTEDLTILIESETSDLDQYADLTSEGDDVEGVTFFFSDRKPIVKIAEELAATGFREHRLRTTLAHELVGHRLCIDGQSRLWRFHAIRASTREAPTGFRQAVGATLVVARHFNSDAPLGHVKLHTGLWQFNQLRLLPRAIAF